MNKYVEIVKGSKVSFDIYLVDEDGFPFSLTGFNAGDLKFRNAAGLETTVALTLPGQEDGKLAVTIESADTGNADSCWQKADIELTETASGEPLIIPLTNLFKVIEPNT